MSGGRWQSYNLGYGDGESEEGEEGEEGEEEEKNNKILLI